MNQIYSSAKCKILSLVAGFLLLIFPSASFSQLVVNPGGTPATIITSLAGSGLTISNPVINCGPDNATAAYGTFNGSASNIALQNGVILTSGLATNAQGPNLMSSITGSSLNDFTDPQLTSVDLGAVYDVCILEFDVVPHCSFMELRFVFGSDEYPEFVNTAFNDAFGFFVTGPDANCVPFGYNNTNVAILPDGTPVAINNVNNGNTFCPNPMPGPCENCANYVDNCGGATVEYDGFTTPIVVDLNVCPCATYHWKFAIADVGDHAYDSGVFIDYLTCASPFAYNLNTLQAGCAGTCTGSASVNITTGTPPYTFLWSTGDTTQSITGLCPGNYSVDVIDAISCGTPLTQNFTITGSPAISTFYSQNNVTCNSGTNGAIVLDSLTGGVGPFDYLWTSSPNDTLASLNGVSAGTYTVVITDANGCTNSQTVIITEPTDVTAAINPPTNIICNGGNNGSATVVAGGGTGGYTYVWTSSTGVVSTTITANGLTAGPYTVTITDASGCTETATTVIAEPTDVTAIINPPTNVTCNGGNSGSAAVVAGGGTGGYTYVWTSSAGIVGSTATAAGLTAGVYSVTVTDANGCTETATTTITEPTDVTAAINPPTDVICNGGNNGSATVVAGGGTGGYAYIWTSSTGVVGSTATASGLTAGPYTVLITDASGCTETATTTIAEPTDVTAAINTPTDVTCNGGNDGSATVVAGGGTGGYTYVWTSSTSVVGSTATVGGLTAGPYAVLITDASGCTETAATIITEPTDVTAIINPPTDVTCNGGNDGTAVVVAGGGTGGYSYVWTSSTGVVSNTAVAAGLVADNYTVVISDGNGCTETATVVIAEPTLVTLSVDGDTTLCFGQATVISASGNGGVPPLNFAWDNNLSIDSVQLVSPATTTTYSVTVTDANGCSPLPQSVLVNVNPPLNVVASATPVICFGSTANISASAGGGNGGPYFYSWNNGVITNPSAVVTPDHDTTFIVEVNDGCSPPVLMAVNIIVNALPVADFTPVTIDGCPPLVVNFFNNSTAPAGSFYHWNLGDGSSSQSQNPSHVYSDPGIYSVSLIVRTPEGCQDTLNVPDVVTVLDVPTSMFAMSEEEISMYNSIVSFTDLSSGAMLWNWDFGDNVGTSDSTNPVYRYEQAGIYTIRLIVENSVGCFDTSYSVLRVKDEITLYVPTGFTPNGDNVNDYFMAYGIGISEFDMWVYDRWGTQVFHTSDKSHPWNGAQDGNGKACQNDVYVYKIKYKDVEGISHDYVGHVALVR
jgi:gliding motility-associated-like protein